MVTRTVDRESQIKLATALIKRLDEAEKELWGAEFRIDSNFETRIREIEFGALPIEEKTEAIEKLCDEYRVCMDQLRSGSEFSKRVEELKQFALEIRSTHAGLARQFKKPARKSRPLRQTGIAWERRELEMEIEDAKGYRMLDIEDARDELKDAMRKIRRRGLAGTERSMAIKDSKAEYRRAIERIEVEYQEAVSAARAEYRERVSK